MSKSRNLANLLADGAVGTTEIANSAITADKLATGAVTAEKLAFTLSSEALSKEFTVSATGSVGAQKVVSLTGSKIGDNPVANTATALTSTASNLPWMAYDSRGLLLTRAEFSGGVRYRQASRQEDGSFVWAASHTQIHTSTSGSYGAGYINHLAGNFYFAGMEAGGVPDPNPGNRTATGACIEVNPTTGAVVAQSNNYSVTSTVNNESGYTRAMVLGIKTDIPNKFVLQETKDSPVWGGSANTSRLATITSSGAISTTQNAGTSEGYNVNRHGWFLLTNNKVLGVRNSSSFGIADYNGSSFQSFSSIVVDADYLSGEFAWYRPTTSTNLFVGAFKNQSNALVLKVYEYNTSTLAMVVRDTLVISTGAINGEIGSISGNGHNIIVGWENNDTGYISTYAVSSVSKTITGVGIPIIQNTSNRTPFVSGPNTDTNVYSTFFNNAASGVSSRRITVLAYQTNELKVVGVAKEAGASNAAVDVAIAGVVGGFTGLTAGAQYYYDTSLYDGSVTTTVTTIYIGRAISSTEILLAL